MVSPGAFKEYDFLVGRYESGRDSPTSLSFLVQVPPGNIHKMVGDHASLGAWNPDSAPSMERSQGHVWTSTVEIPAGTTIDFKVSHDTASE